MKKESTVLPIEVNASIWGQEILENQIEKIADQGFDLGYKKISVHPGFNAMDTSSIEVYVNGNVIISKGHELFDHEFQGNFLFTCIQVKDENYDLEWSASLS